MQFTASHVQNILEVDSSSVKKVNEVCISSNVGAGFGNESGELNKNYVQQEILILPACAKYKDGNLRLKTRPLIEYTVDESECKDDFLKYSHSDSDNYDFKHSGTDSLVKSILSDSEKLGDEYSPLFPQLYSSKMLTGEAVNFELRSVDTFSDNVVYSDQISDTFCDEASGIANDVSDENNESDYEALMYKAHYFSLLTISTFESLSENESSDSKLSLSHNKTIPLHKWEMESDDEPVNDTEKAPGQLPLKKMDICE